jgi:hypothetical protein
MSTNPTAAPTKVWTGWCHLAGAWVPVVTHPDKLRCSIALELAADERRVPGWATTITTGRRPEFEPAPPPRRWFDGRA